MEFIASGETAGHSGAAAEQAVWQTIRRAFGPGDEGVAYWRYPIIDPNGAAFDREADFLLLHRDIGLVVVECKGYRLDHIGAIQGDRWQLQGTRQTSATPYTQARDQGFRLVRHLRDEPALVDDRGNCTVPLHFFVALPNVGRDEWDDRFGGLPSAPPVITDDELTPGSLRDRLESVPGNGLTHDEFRAARAVLSGGQPISGERGGRDEDAASSPGDTKADLAARVERGLKRLDREQEELALQVPDGPQQIRGIAGSGKTVLLAGKAAQLHARHPDWRIVVTFQTRSLYETVTETIAAYYRHFTGGDPDWSRLQVMHGWGGRTRRGLYFEAAQAAGVEPRTYSEAREAFADADPGDEDDPFAGEGDDDDDPEHDLLHHCCAEVLDSGEPQERYDAVLVDEAQDFDPAFFRLCHAVLRPPKRLVWAYDEAQSLQSLSAPSPTEIFGTDSRGRPTVDLSGAYEGGVQKSRILRKAYRTPRPALLLAHVFGMGLCRDAGAVQALTTQSGWEDLGYDIEGDFRRYGTPVTLRRPAEHSPHPLSEVSAARPFVRVERFPDRGAELDHVADAIARDVREDDLDPSQVLVVTLGSVGGSRDAGERLAQRLGRRGIDANLVWDGDPDVFTEDGAVTIARINRAKGNQAPQVYVVGVDTVADATRRASLVQRRNEAFVAITRTTAWVTVTGSGGPDRVFAELRDVTSQVTGDDPVVTFPAPEQGALERTMLDATLDAF
ncbi:nuclease-related domain-containing DEAD/DEAH box helicase [Haloarchaeobius amylolyticus]|uniref:nuclease-related domain-containing DEAD/DEAH box helicase n=1 Tax=Haloarchaeobius amylolyticus TaxID=1198296 RepID=UPI00226DE69C